MRLLTGEVLRMNGRLAGADTRGRTITLTVCDAAEGKLVFLLKTAGLNVPLGGNIEVFTGKGG